MTHDPAVPTDPAWRRSPIGAEALDSPELDAELARRTLADVALANRFLGGSAAVAYGMRRLFDAVEGRNPVSVLDVGAGAGDVLDRVRRMAARRGMSLTGVALDAHPAAARMARERQALPVRADAFALPIASGAIDFVVASQLLHHFARPAAVALLTELDRIARLGVVVADLRRTRRAALGIWLGSFVLGFHPISRADGVVSVRRGFTTAELASLCADAGLAAVVRRRPGFRVVAYWRKRDAYR